MHIVIYWKSIIEVIILWYVIYKLFLFLKGTKALYLLRGIFLLIIAYFLFQWLNFYTLSWVLARLLAFSVILIVVIFQPELREALIKLGRRHIFYVEPKEEDIDFLIKEIVTAVGTMSRKKIGALIAIKRDIGLKNYIESGIMLNAKVSSELLQNIFYPFAPLHDGGVIIDGLEIVAAACLFPLTSNPNIDKTLGMRHKAAVGLSEDSDAIIIVISEETGSVSLAINGQLTRNLSLEDLRTILKGLLKSRKK